MIIDFLLYVLIIGFGINVLLTIFLDDEEKVLIIINNSGENIMSYKLNSLTKIDDDENHFNFDINEEILLSDIEYPQVYDLDEINNCFVLLNEFSLCFLNNNEFNYECQKSFENNVYELEKCDLILNSVSSMDMKDKFNKLLENNKNGDIDIFKYSKEEGKNNINNIYEEEEKIENEEMKKKKDKIFQDIINSFIMKNDKDCVEYELSEQDNNIIKCVKYE